jgi:hypothetical protein
MATVVTITDRPSWDANTDNIIVVDSAQHTLLWIPRDVWCPRLGDRINRAYAIGGAEALTSALSEHGITAEHGLCLRRDAVEAALECVAITVPVARHMAIWYPLDPLARIEDGRRLVTFVPPSESLTGERIHQWLGARSRAPFPGLRGALERAGRRLRLGRRDPSFPDLDRIERHKILLRALLANDFDFTRALEDPARYRVTGEAVWAELRRVRADWTFATMQGIEPRTIEGKAVLVAGDADDPGRANA